MKSNTFIFLGIIVVIGGAWYFSTQGQPAPATEQSNTLLNQPTIVITPGTETITEDSRYVAYSQSAFDAAKAKKRVFFFHAPWCPTCKPADAAFQENEAQIPQDVILFKTDYDSSKDLKKQYAITYQHTYVLVDNTGKEVKKWNGGGIDELIENTK